MNFAQVKSITIPEGSAKQLAQGLTVLWKKSSTGATDLIVPVYSGVYPTYNDVARGFPITLPSGYVRVEYITGSGGSAINTGIVVAGTDIIYGNYELSSLSQGGDKYILSQQAGYTGGGLWVETYGSANKWYFRFGSSSSANATPTSAQLSGQHEFVIKKNSFKVDDVSVGTPNYSSMPSTSLCIGGRLNSAGDAITGGAMYGKLRDNFGVVDSNGVARWWGFTVKRTADSAGGMWDAVSGQFFPSVTSTDFGCGPEV